MCTHPHGTEPLLHGGLFSYDTGVCIIVRLESLVLETEHFLHGFPEGRIDDAVQNEVGGKVYGLHHVGDDFNGQVRVIGTEIFPKQKRHMFEDF